VCVYVCESAVVRGWVRVWVQQARQQRTGLVEEGQVGGFETELVRVHANHWIGRDGRVSEWLSE